jgi:hypothetical protein
LPLQVEDVGLVTLGGKLTAISAATIMVHVAISSLFGLEEARATLNKVRQLILRPIKL